VMIEATNEGEQYLSATFVIAPEKLEAQGRSLGLLLLHRRCAACWGTLVQEAAGGLEIPWEDHLERIANHCSASQEFIVPGMPVMEAVFRSILSRNNEPTSLADLLETLQTRWSDASSHWAPSPASLYRMVTRDIFYGIQEVASPQGG